MNDESLWLLNLVANISQIIDLGLNISQTSNDELMKELQKQDKEYFEKIIKNQEKIIEMLENMSL